MKRINRTRSKNSINNKEYKNLSWIYETEPYWDEGYNYYPKYRRGFKNPNKQIYMKKVRECKTWKHNRKKQWK